jgi:hypothetical protein
MLENQLDVQGELQDLTWPNLGAFWNINERENERMKDAMNYLKEKGKLKKGIAEIGGALEQRIADRFEKIDDYRGKRDQQIVDAMTKFHSQREEELERKGNDMLNQ